MGIVAEKPLLQIHALLGNFNCLWPFQIETPGVKRMNAVAILAPKVACHAALGHKLNAASQSSYETLAAGSKTF